MPKLMSKLLPNTHITLSHSVLLKISEETGIPIWEMEHLSCGNTQAVLKEYFGNKRNKATEGLHQTYRNTELGTLENFLAKDELNQQCLREIAGSNNFEEIFEIYNYSPHECTSNLVALDRMLALANTKEQLLQLLNICKVTLSERRSLALAKLLKLYEKETL